MENQTISIDWEKQIISIDCSKCKRRTIVKMPDKPRKYRVTCSNSACQAEIHFYWAGEQKPNMPIEEKNADVPSSGKLVQIRRLRTNLTFRLMEGDNIIGRADDCFPSKISIEGDGRISRQSVNIKAIRKPQKGYLFKFTVLRASNKVQHNQKLLSIGESVYLNYGDNIVLGNTHFRFEKI